MNLDLGQNKQIERKRKAETFSSPFWLFGTVITDRLTAAERFHFNPSLSMYVHLFSSLFSFTLSVSPLLQHHSYNHIFIFFVSLSFHLFSTSDSCYHFLFPGGWVGSRSHHKQTTPGLIWDRTETTSSQRSRCENCVHTDPNKSRGKTNQSLI